MGILEGKKVVRCDQEVEMPRVDAQLEAWGAQLVKLSRFVSEGHLKTELKDSDLLLMCYTPISASVIEELPRGSTKLKGIVKYGVGIDAIDIDAAKKAGIPVVNIPDYAESTVAEGAFALMIGLAKKAKKIQKAMDLSGWVSPTSEWMGLDLLGKTVGLVGLGKIGTRFAKMASNGFQMQVIGYDPYVSETQMKKLGIHKYSEIYEMVRHCDFVSIHCPLNHETRGLFGEKEFCAMKSSAFLINVSRGQILDETALLRALHEKRIAGAALDVYSQEPLRREGHPLSSLFDMENVILWPHLTFYTEEAMLRLEEETLLRVLELMQDRPVLIKSFDPRLRSQKHGVVYTES